MSDLHELPDLAGDVRDRVVVPPYAEVSRRVRARRRRTAAGTLACAVLVVGGIAVGQQLATEEIRTLPRPAGSSGPISPTDESQWRSVVNGTKAGPFEVSGTDDGSVAVVWRALEHQEPAFALVIREADGSVHGRRLEAPVTLTPVPGGWVGLETARGWLIGSDGSWTDLGVARDPRPPEAGDVAVAGQFGRWLYRPGDRSWSTLSVFGSPDQAYVNDFGNLITCTGHDGRVTVGDQDRSGQPNPDLPGVTCVIAGNGDTVVVAALGDDPSGAIPLTGVLRSTDGGATWTRPPFDAFSSITSQVVGADGTILVTGTEGRSFVIHPDGAYTEPTVPLGLAFAAGDRLYATSYGHDKGPLLVSRYHGATWAETRLPGLE